MQPRQQATLTQPFQCDLQPQLQETQRTTHTGTTTRCRTQRRNQSRPERPATLHGKIQGFVLRLPPQHKAHATFMQPFLMRSATTASRNAKNYARRNNHSLQNTEEEPIASRTTTAATATHTRYLSSPAAATSHGKKQCFMLRLPPHNKAHWPFMHLPHHFPSSPLPLLHTTLHQGQFFCDVLLCSVKCHPSSRSTLLWCIVM